MKKIVLIVMSVMMVSGLTFAQESQKKSQSTAQPGTKSATQDKTSVNTSQGTGTASPASSPSAAQPKTGNQPNEHNRGNDLEFVNEASSAGLMEVQLGKLAQQKGSSVQVKEFGRMMERDHSDANNKLKSAVQKLGVPASSTLQKKHQDNVDDLSKKSGADFDKAYVDLMVKDHKEDVEKFEKASNDIQEPALRQWVTSTLPVLKKHLAEAEKLQNQVK
jgi:putative membrane protein